MTRYLARRVIHGGKTFPLSVVTIEKRADGLWHVDVQKFTREIHSTSYHPGTLLVCSPHDHSLPYTPGTEPPAIELLP